MQIVDKEDPSNGMVSRLKERFIKPMSIVKVMVVHASVASSKLKVKLDSHTDTCGVGDNCFIIHGNYWPFNVYTQDPKDGHSSEKTFDATVGYSDPHIGQKYIFIINQAIRSVV